MWARQEWKEENKFMNEQLLPDVLLASSPETKNRVLTEGIYDYFGERYMELDNLNQSNTREKEPDRIKP